MSHFVIQGQAPLSGSIPVYGSKNAALPLLAACLLTDEPVTIDNIPPILDVPHILDIFRSLGAQASMEGSRVTVQASRIDPTKIPPELVSKLRGSILLLGALLGRSRAMRLPRPGGDIIGARPIEVHLDAFRQLGATVTEDGDYVAIDGQEMQPGIVVLQEFSVTATENVMLAAACLPGTTTIRIAAAEPHVVALAELLSQMGAKVSGAGTHTITITGANKLRGAHLTTIPDMLEAGLFILMAAATKSEITVEHVPINDLELFFKKIDDIGIHYDQSWENEALGLSSITVKPSVLRSFNVQTLPYPGVPTDLQAPFSVIATQVTGSSLIHDPMYEGRFKYVSELQKMGANIVVCDPHRIIITGPTPLSGRRIPSLDIRAGATLLMAGLIAKGETIIDNAEIIDRGYANIVDRLQAIGANITREQ
ncbi:MAG: UDP-N-acetylglucosamine 1-carboxyvinyltransferase [Candidatus Andersenbacteria bacterium]|nr:UDP-N-acetylglucosamine 1-carboxyvinyltransferase [Candidatus Andersenbacteria bacterium]